MPFYIIIRGPLGCGKSTISERLAKELGAKRISIDRIVDNPKLVNQKWEEGYISQKSFFKANEIAVKRVKDDLDKGKLIIFDGNFYWKSAIDDLISRLDYKHYVFTLKAPVEVCIDRDKNRNKTHGEDAARAVYKKSTSFSYGNVINTERKTANETLKEIKRKLR